MKPSGIAYVVIGIVALAGAAATAFVLINLYGALGIINSSPDQLPPGTDVAALQETVSSLNTLILLGTIWLISVILAGAVCIRTGLANLRAKKIKPMGR